VISPERFRTRSGGLRVSMQEAMLANEFERLGEKLIMTKPSLRLVLSAATASSVDRRRGPRQLHDWICEILQPRRRAN
jgi:hypothetical protein